MDSILDECLRAVVVLFELVEGVGVFDARDGGREDEAVGRVAGVAVGLGSIDGCCA